MSYKRGQVGKPYIFHEITNPLKQNKPLPVQQKERNLCITVQALHMLQLSPPLTHCTHVDSGLTSFFIQSLFCRLRLSFPFLFSWWAVTSNAGCIFSAIVTKWTSSATAEQWAEYFWHHARRRAGHEDIWPIRASDQSELFRLNSSDWSACCQSCSCHRGLITSVPFSEHIMQWLLSEQQDHFTQCNIVFLNISDFKSLHQCSVSEASNRLSVSRETHEVQFKSGPAGGGAGPPQCQEPVQQNSELRTTSENQTENNLQISQNQSLSQQGNHLNQYEINK